MRGDRVPIRSLDFRDFWVLDISQPSHSTREAGGPSTRGWGREDPERGSPFLDCHRRCQASRTRLLRPACDGRPDIPLPRQHCGRGITCFPCPTFSYYGRTTCRRSLRNLQFLQRPDPFAPFTPDPHCPDRLARTALAVDLPRRWRVIPADRSDFARSGLPMAVNQCEQHAALQTTPAAPGRGEIYKRRGISIFHCGFG